MDRARNMKKPSPKSNALEARTFKLQHELPTFWWTTETSLYFAKKLEQLFTCVFKNGSFTASSKSGSNWSAAIPRSAWSVDVENGTFFGPFLASWGHHIPRGLRCRPVNFLTSCEKKKNLGFCRQTVKVAKCLKLLRFKETPWDWWSKPLCEL